ncbi:MAG: hypothetical protein AAGF20_09465, partial [Pseudomonadota bacterium]
TMQIGDMPPTLVRMQASTYARFVGLDSAGIADGYTPRRSQPKADAMPGERLRIRRLIHGRKRLFGTLAAAGVLSIGALAIVFLSRQASGVDRQIAVAERLPIPDLQTVNAALEIRSESAPELAIVAQRAAWIEVRGSDGTIFRSRTMSPRERYYPRLQAGWTVTVRDAGAFTWHYGDLPVGPLGEADTPAYSVSVDAAYETAKALASRSLASTKSAASQE